MKRSLSILLVQPSNERTVMDSGASAPLWPCLLKALTPDQHQVDFVQCSFEPLDEERISRYDLVGISTWTHTAPHAYQIGDMCRRVGVPCVMGGIHPFVCTEEAAQHADALVLGEAEYVWATLLDDACRERLQPRYRGDLTRPEDIPSPDYSVLSRYRYGLSNVIETIRGCPFHCNFCTATLFSGSRYRYKPIDRVLREVEALPNPSRPVLFADANIASNFGLAKELCRALRSYGLTWLSCVSTNTVHDDELLRLMGESGCAYLDIGFESVVPETLASMNKRQNKASDYRLLIDKLHDNNIDVIGNFIYGLDTDTPDVFARTVDFVHQAQLDIPVYGILVPFPGTKIYVDMMATGRLRTGDWSRYSKSDVVYQPRAMSAEQLLEGFFWSYQQSYSLPSGVRRSLSRWRGIKRNIYNAVIVGRGRRSVKQLWREHLEATRSPSTDA